MYKSALGALALSLSIGLIADMASAQTQAQTHNASSASTSAASSGDGVQNYGSQTVVPPASGTNGGNPNPPAPAASEGKSNGSDVKTTNAGKSNTGDGKNASETKGAGNAKSAGTTGNTSSTSSTTNSGATTAAVAGQTPAKKKAADEMVSVQVSKPMVSSKLAWQTFDDFINLKQGQDQIPLTMTVTNAGFQSLVLHLNGSKLATEKDFKTTTLAMQMTGALAVGDNKFTIQGYGKPGAKVSWTLETPRAVITDVQPTTSSAIDKLTVTGRNFAKTVAGDQVQIGTKWATIISGDSKKINIQVPTGITGKQKLAVFAGGFQSKPFEYTIKASPVVTGLDLISAPPGQPLTIFGTGFSPVAKENVATIGGVPANVQSATTTTLSVIIPEMYYPQWNVPVVVKIGTVESNKNILINVQTRVINNQGVGEM